jgi:hypothetical protein
VEPPAQRGLAVVGHSGRAGDVEDRRGDDLGADLLQRGDDGVVVRQHVVAALEVAPDDVVAAGDEWPQYRHGSTWSGWNGVAAGPIG